MPSVWLYYATSDKCPMFSGSVSSLRNKNGAKIMVKVVEQTWHIDGVLDGISMVQKIERIARLCYKSEEKITEHSYLQMVKMLVDNEHWAMIEHGGVITVHITGNRGLSHELVRHRLCSFAQESTRYCDYDSGRFGGQITVVRPLWVLNTVKELNRASESGIYTELEEVSKIWLRSMRYAQKSYNELSFAGYNPQSCRGVLPIDVKAEIYVTANLRQWYHILELRTATTAHPQIRGIMREILKYFHEEIPFIFDKLANEKWRTYNAYTYGDGKNAN